MLNITLWVLQCLLALAFLFHGWLFLRPSEAVAEQMNAMISPAFRMFIGAAEVLAAIGLILPGITRVKPWLVPAAAAGLTVVTISATAMHVVRSDALPAATTSVLTVPALLVAYLRWRVRPIAPRKNE